MLIRDTKAKDVEVGEIKSFSSQDLIESREAFKGWQPRHYKHVEGNQALCSMIAQE